MNPKSIGSVLKYYRKLRNISVKDVSEYLNENHAKVCIKTIYGWENNHTEPDIHTLILLCRLYQIDDMMQAFGCGTAASPCEINPTAHELDLIRRYRCCPDLQPAIDKILDL